MRTIEYRDVVKKSEFGPGPWQDEPDKIQWPDAETGLPCLIVRNPNLGFLCGYVGVLPGHPLHGIAYDDADVDAHGGLTYADGCGHEDDPSQNVCHIPDKDEPEDVWWFGFDCAHCQDVYPYMMKARGRDVCDEFGTYKDIEYVKKECANLAKQLKVME